MLVKVYKKVLIFAYRKMEWLKCAENRTLYVNKKEALRVQSLYENIQLVLSKSLTAHSFFVTLSPVASSMLKKP